MISGRSATYKESSGVRITTPASFISDELVMASFAEKAYLQNTFVLFLADRFGAEVAEDRVKKYRIGNSKHRFAIPAYSKYKGPVGAVVFWQIDKDEKVRSGKVMLYDRATGKRVKAKGKDGEMTPLITWVHSILKLENFNLEQCFFGTHLLAEEPEDKPVAIVESEKTAIIASLYFPEFIWLACGGKQMIKSKRLDFLHGRKIVLFPDLNGYNEWQQAVKDLPGVMVSDILETVATDEERENGLDLADYLLRYDHKEFIGSTTQTFTSIKTGEVFSLEINASDYPSDWDSTEELPGYQQRREAFETKYQLQTA